MKKNFIILICLVSAVAAAVAMAYFSHWNVREMPPDRNSTPDRDQAIVQVSRPKTPSNQELSAGPDIPMQQQKKITLTLPETTTESEELTENSSETVQAPTAEEVVDEIGIHYRAMVFRDEALSSFPVHTVQVFQPESITENIQTGRIGGPNFGPKSNEVWIRIKPDNAKEMSEIMAQTADLYREYLKEEEKNIVVVNWVGGQAWARMEFAPDGSLVTQ